MAVKVFTVRAYKEEVCICARAQQKTTGRLIPQFLPSASWTVTAVLKVLCLTVCARQALGDSSSRLVHVCPIDTVISLAEQVLLCAVDLHKSGVQQVVCDQ